MKKTVIFLAALCFLLIDRPCAAQNEISFSASEILDKAIKFHDPQGKWENYSGKVKLNTSFQYGHTAGDEIIEINITENFYKCTRLAGGLKVVKGIQDGKIFRSINGNSNPGQEEIKKFGLLDSSILAMKEWHYFHFGRLMYFKKSGAELQAKVTKSNFQGKECYQLTFIGTRSKIKNPYLARHVIFNIAIDNFALLGLQMIPENKSPGYIVYESFLEVNGIKIPRVGMAYLSKDNSLILVDLFTRADDNYSVPAEYRTRSNVTGSNIGLVSTHLLKLENKESVANLNQPLKEINDIMAVIGFPECGYIIYETNPESKTEYTHIMEGWWMNKEVYDLIHNHPKFKEFWGKNGEPFNPVLTGQTYFRVNKLWPKL